MGGMPKWLLTQCRCCMRWKRIESWQRFTCHEYLAKSYLRVLQLVQDGGIGSCYVAGRQFKIVIIFHGLQRRLKQSYNNLNPRVQSRFIWLHRGQLTNQFYPQEPLILHFVKGIISARRLIAAATEKGNLALEGVHKIIKPLADKETPPSATLFSSNDSTNFGNQLGGILDEYLPRKQRIPQKRGGRQPMCRKFSNKKMLFLIISSIKISLTFEHS